MAPEFGETQAIPQYGASAPAPSVQTNRDEAALPAMEDIDRLVAELDMIDATLAQLG